jgi:hypothetical protein
VVALRFYTTFAYIYMNRPAARTPLPAAQEDSFFPAHFLGVEVKSLVAL